jgi:hypothetical protein
MPAPLSFGPTDGWSGVDNPVKFISIVCLQLGPSSNFELSCYKTRWRHALGPFLGSAMHVFSLKCFLVNEVAADWYSLVMSYGHDDTSGHTISKQAYTAEHPSCNWVPSRTSAPMNQAVVRRSMQERLDQEGLCRSRYQL